MSRITTWKLLFRHVPCFSWDSYILGGPFGYDIWLPCLHYYFGFFKMVCVCPSLCLSLLSSVGADHVLLTPYGQSLWCFSNSNSYHYLIFQIISQPSLPRGKLHSSWWSCASNFWQDQSSSWLSLFIFSCHFGESLFILCSSSKGNDEDYPFGMKKKNKRKCIYSIRLDTSKHCWMLLWGFFKKIWTIM